MEWEIDSGICADWWIWDESYHIMQERLTDTQEAAIMLECLDEYRWAGEREWEEVASQVLGSCGRGVEDWAIRDDMVD